MKNVIQKIRKLVGVDDLSSAIEELSLIKSKQLDEIIIQSARHNDLKRQIRLGVIDSDKANIEKNGIRLALLEIINSIEINIETNKRLKAEINSHKFEEELNPNSGCELKFVSSNHFKHQEYKLLLKPHKVTFSRINVDESQNINIEKIVRKKIEALKPIFGDSPFFVDETALIIEDWNGLPGGMTDQFFESVGCVGLCKMLDGYENSDRYARAVTVIGYSFDDTTEIFSDTIFGRITKKPIDGEYNFGWNSIFIPEDCKMTLSQIGIKEKNKISMRAKAAFKFKKYLKRKNTVANKA